MGVKAAGALGSHYRPRVSSVYKVLETSTSLSPRDLLRPVMGQPHLYHGFQYRKISKMISTSIFTRRVLQNDSISTQARNRIHISPAGDGCKANVKNSVLNKLHYGSGLSPFSYSMGNCVLFRW